MMNNKANTNNQMSENLNENPTNSNPNIQNSEPNNNDLKANLKKRLMQKQMEKQLEHQANPPEKTNETVEKPAPTQTKPLERIIESNQNQISSIEKIDKAANNPTEKILSHQNEKPNVPKPQNQNNELQNKNQRQMNIIKKQIAPVSQEFNQKRPIQSNTQKSNNPTEIKKNIIVLPSNKKTQNLNISSITNNNLNSNTNAIVNLPIKNENPNIQHVDLTKTIRNPQISKEQKPQNNPNPGAAHKINKIVNENTSNATKPKNMPEKSTIDKDKTNPKEQSTLVKTTANEKPNMKDSIKPSNSMIMESATTEPEQTKIIENQTKIIEKPKEETKMMIEQPKEPQQQPPNKTNLKRKSETDVSDMMPNNEKKKITNEKSRSIGNSSSPKSIKSNFSEKASINKPEEKNKEMIIEDKTLNKIEILSKTQTTPEKKKSGENPMKKQKTEEDTTKNLKIDEKTQKQPNEIMKTSKPTNNNETNIIKISKTQNETVKAITSAEKIPKTKKSEENIIKSQKPQEIIDNPQKPQDLSNKALKPQEISIKTPKIQEKLQKSIEHEEKLNPQKVEKIIEEIEKPEGDIKSLQEAMIIEEKIQPVSSLESDKNQMETPILEENRSEKMIEEVSVTFDSSENKDNEKVDLIEYENIKKKMMELEDVIKKVESKMKKEELNVISMEFEQISRKPYYQRLSNLFEFFNKY